MITKLKSILISPVSSYCNLNFGLFALLIFFTPIIFATDTKELFEFPKMFFVYILGTTIIYLFLLNRILSPRKLRYPNKLITLFVVSNLISTVLSSHLYTSLWGYYSRFNGGLISVLVFFGLYFVAINTLKREQVMRLILLSVLSIFIVGTNGIFQHFSLNAVRVTSTFGQPNWLAAYLAMLLPIICYLIFNSTQNIRPLQLVAYKNILWITLYTIGFACLWFTYSLSGLLGFCLGILTLAILNYKRFFIGPLGLLRYNLNKLFVIVLLTIIIVIFNLGVFENRINDVITDLKITSHSKYVYAISTVESTNKTLPKYNLSDTGAIRRGMWKGTLDLILSSPKVFLFGTGPETFPYEFQAYRPPELNYTSEWDFILNKPHNYYLELWSQLGILGLGTYILLIWYSLQTKHRIITPSLITLFISNIFSWPVVSTSLLFWIWLAALYPEQP